MFSFTKKKLTTIGDGTFICSIPDSFTTETEENGTLLTYDPQKDNIFYRISFISFEPKDVNENKAGEKNVQEEINIKKLEQKKIGQYNVAIISETQIKNDSYMIKYWKLGLGNNIFILSVTFPSSKINEIKKYNVQMENIIKSIQINEHSEKLSVDGAEINYTEKLGNQNQKTQLRDLTKEEKEFINKNIDLGKKIADSFCVKEIENELKKLDVIFRKYLDCKSEFSDDEIAVGLGVLFGEIMRDQLSMEWQMITDEYGTDYCLNHKKTNTMIFPISTVYKRVESGEYDFFWAIYQIVKKQIEEGIA